MFETVTVDQALKKGKKTLTLPTILILLGCFAISGFILLETRLPVAVPIVVLVLSFIIPGIYWSVAVTKWRIWAFSNVRNVHELKKRATKEGLIGKDGGFFEKTEIRSAGDKHKLADLQNKFNTPDVFLDDFSVPSETEIRYSRNKILVEVGLGLLVVGGGVFMWTSATNNVMGIGLCIVGVIIMIRAIVKMNNKAPQVIISAKGIQTSKTQFYEWKDVQREDVVAVQAGRSRINYLMYNHPMGSEKLDIREFDISKHELERLLRLYRGRYQKNEARS